MQIVFYNDWWREISLQKVIIVDEVRGISWMSLDTLLLHPRSQALPSSRGESSLVPRLSPHPEGRAWERGSSSCKWGLGMRLIGTIHCSITCKASYCSLYKPCDSVHTTSLYAAVVQMLHAMCKIGYCWIQIRILSSNNAVRDSTSFQLFTQYI